MIGEAALVPPNWYQPPLDLTRTPVAGSATADTSACMRFEQPESVCQDGLGSYGEQPLPAPPWLVTLPHALSLQPLVLESLTRLVPPTATTYWEADGNWATLAEVTGGGVGLYLPVQ